MGVPAFIFVNARHRDGSGRDHDRRPARAQYRRLRGWIAAGLIGLAGPLTADTIRIATFAAPLSRDGPGLLLRDYLRGEDPQIAATVAVIARVAPDILVLTDHDYDLTGAAASLLTDLLTDAGQTYPHRFALVPNGGMATGLDLDGNRRLGEARDAMGYGLFAGDGGLLILSKLPLDAGGVQDFSGLLWRDLPGATLPQRDGAPFPSADVRAMLRLSSVAHWAVPVLSDPPFTLLVSSSSPPVFDGPEDMNGLRNRDELRLWGLYLDGAFGPAPASFVFSGNTNLDPADGDGLRDAMAGFLADPRLKDPRPASAGGQAAADSGQIGDPARDTADWPDGKPGNLRVSYVLPSTDWRIAGAGVFWPAPDDPDAALLGSDGQASGPHHLVWVDVSR